MFQLSLSPPTSFGRFRSVFERNLPWRVSARSRPSLSVCPSRGFSFHFVVKFWISSNRFYGPVWSCPLVSRLRSWTLYAELISVQLTAIIVACLASFRTLYTRSKRRKPASREQHRSDQGQIFQGGNRSLSSNKTEGNATQITANGDTYGLGPQLSTSSKDQMLPINAVYVQQGFSVLPEQPRVYNHV